jgi:hypothetical protein
MGGKSEWVLLLLRRGNPFQSPRSLKEVLMGLVFVLLLLALLFGGIGLFVEGLKWVLIIALVLLVVGAFSGYRTRGTRV